MIRLLALLAFLPLDASAAACTDRDTLVKGLSMKYGEHPEATGITPQGGVIEVFRTESGSSWTITLVNPQGIACIVATGTSWINRGKKPGVEL